MNYLLFRLRVPCVMKKFKLEEQEQLFGGPVCLKSVDLVLLAKLMLDELVKKSLISVAEFHLCKCLNVIATYVFPPTPHCKRNTRSLVPVIHSLKKQTKTVKRLPNESTGNVSIKMCNSNCN